ncbi:MAG: histidine kinase [Devosia sp.]|uniref:sensor histidine kinase n=1 Tax=Devosia sp. TaxID=1871048 RepID=UPI0026140918|nr:CHASE3 domain-containing protein [Devosia sp.]MDB5527691.1 histidine kinase [Devosia sp.]
MPISGNALVRSTAALLLVGLLALAAIVGTTIWLVERNQVYFDQGLEARIIRSATINLRNALQDAETSQRGFLLTGEDRYLEPYNKAVPQIPDLLERVVTVLKPYPEAPAAGLRGGVADKLAELTETIALAQAGNRDQAMAIIETDRGKNAMDELRTLFDGIISSAEERIRAGIEDQRGSTNALRWVTIIGAFVIFVVVGGSAWTVMVYTRDIARARADLEAANTGLEERVRERTADLGKANEEIQRFAYIVTHDLRAPLVNIMGFTAELESSVGTLQSYMSGHDDGDDPRWKEARLAATEDLPEAIGFIRSSTRKMDGLINAILKISLEGRRQLRPEQVDLNEVIETSTSAVHHQISENGGSVTSDVKVPRIVSDKLSLEQILGNLLDNAVKYQDAARPLTITVRAALAAGNRILIHVQDNGRGIAGADHERVFELFRRSGAQSLPGEGIGLAHVRTMVRSLGGEITLASELGTGTTFTISLPRDLRDHVGSMQ